MKVGNKMIRSIFVGLVLFFFLFLGLLPLVFIVYLTLCQNRLVDYLDKNNPELLKKLSLNIPIINMRFTTLEYPLLKPVSLFRYLTNDSEDDKQSMYYKNRYRLSLLIMLICLLIMVALVIVF